ncbi:serine protease [Brevirhabdus pacifica]|uniref:Serine protease n=1 Tax=Brevirhabdus pacifica TaxID=1267768 RepID=A0A1U7DLZ5_9RHOB|nr:serine protease [Brevirhabdus pacifica]OWU74296.1 serine protease [Loktanella sp. 22II-4b]
MPALVAQSEGAPARQAPESQPQVQLSFAPVVKTTAPAVVNIYAKRELPQRRSPFADDPFFSQFFGHLDRGSPRFENSLGSGVILSADGLVVSNYHVAGGATDIRVVLSDRREFDAKVLLGDPEADLLVMRIEDARDLPFLRLADSDAIEVGDLVLAIGNPFGVGQTVSSGIVSGLARSGGDLGRGTGYFIQTDAPINPGNSGGALVDMQGRLVGVNTSILTRSGGSNGIGFAIPANLIAQYLRQADEGLEAPRRPWAGLTVQEMTSALAEAVGMDRPAGVIITRMHPQSPFGQAGLRRGDVVVQVDGRPVDRPAELLFRLLAAGTGTEVTVSYLRPDDQGAANGTAPRQASVELFTAPETPPRDAVTIRTGALAGLTLANINPAVIDEMDLPLELDQGVVVLSVEGPARRLRLRPGDLITAINGTPVSSSADLRRLGGGAAVSSLDIERDGQRARLRLR